jgi:hypothetical protein
MWHELDIFIMSLPFILPIPCVKWCALVTQFSPVILLKYHFACISYILLSAVEEFMDKVFPLAFIRNPFLSIFPLFTFHVSSSSLRTCIHTSKMTEISLDTRLSARDTVLFLRLLRPGPPARNGKRLSVELHGFCFIKRCTGIIPKIWQSSTMDRGENTTSRP